MLTQLSPIEAHENKLGDIFGDAYAFEIPSYQRPYAWEEQQVQELLTDLLDAMDNGTENGGVYFLGSIVLIKSPNDPQCKVVDGQQRLTTLTILFSVLRDLTSDNETKISRRTYIYQKANPDSGTQDRFRLLLRERDRAFFQRYIQQPDATNQKPDMDALEGSQQCIARNAYYLRSQLEVIPEERRNALIAFLVQRCYLVIVAVPTPEAARRIFTVLNARGLDLTATDILKANLLERAGSVIEKNLADRWESVELDIGRDKMVELFGHMRMMYERDKPRIALEVGFSKYVTPFNENANQFVSELLEPIADAWLLLSNPEKISKKFGSEVVRAVNSLERIDNKDWVPPILLRLWKRSKSDSEAVAKFIINLERVAYYLFVTRADINARIARFSTVMDEFDPRAGKESKTGLTLSSAEQKEFLEALSGPLYLKARVCKPVMQRLDEALSSGGASYDQLVSIEHVLPQTVDEDSEWYDLFPDEEQREEWTHRLANLVFLTHRINKRSSNWGFDRKKEEYFSSEDGSSPFPITQSVLQAKRWSVDYLESRQEKLLSVLAKVWQLKSGSVTIKAVA